MEITKDRSALAYETALFFWRIIIQIFFREIRPRGAFNIPRDGPVIFVGAPHHNQVSGVIFDSPGIIAQKSLKFLDPLLLSWQVHRESRRRVQFLTAAKSMQRKFVGFFSRLMLSSTSIATSFSCTCLAYFSPTVPVARAVDYASPGTGRIRLSPDDPCLVLGEGTKFTTEFSPKMQIMLPKSLNSIVAEVAEVISDTEIKIKREFGGESGKGTARFRDKVAELSQEGVNGLEFKKLPFVDQQKMYRHVYQCLKDGGCMGIFPEGKTQINSAVSLKVLINYL